MVISLLCPSGSEHKHHESQHQTHRSLWGAQTRRNKASWRLPRNTLHPFFADLIILRPRVKGRSFRHGGAVVMREALSRHLPAGWVRCKAHHHGHPPLRVHQVASGGTATLTPKFQLHEIPRAPFTPSSIHREQQVRELCNVSIV